MYDLNVVVGLFSAWMNGKLALQPYKCTPAIGCDILLVCWHKTKSTGLYVGLARRFKSSSMASSLIAPSPVSLLMDLNWGEYWKAVSICSPDLLSFEELCEVADDKLFDRILSNSSDILHPLLPPPTIASGNCNLRPKPHINNFAKAVRTPQWFNFYHACLIQEHLGLMTLFCHYSCHLSRCTLLSPNICCLTNISLNEYLTSSYPA